MRYVPCSFSLVVFMFSYTLTRNCINLYICIHHLKHGLQAKRHQNNSQSLHLLLLLLDCVYNCAPRFPYCQFQLLMLHAWLLTKFRWRLYWYFIQVGYSAPVAIWNNIGLLMTFFVESIYSFLMNWTHVNYREEKQVKEKRKRKDASKLHGCSFTYMIMSR